MVEHCLHLTLATMYLLAIHFLYLALHCQLLLNCWSTNPFIIEAYNISTLRNSIYLVIENGMSFWREINKFRMGSSSSNCSCKTNEETEVL